MHKSHLLGIVLGCVLLAAVIFSGMSIDNRTFTWKQKHVSAQTDIEHPAYLVARNYQQLLECTQAILLAGEEGGTIRYYHDSDDIDAELARACAELMLRTPIGAFAVEALEMRPAPVLTYHNIRVTAKYKRSKEEIRAIHTLNSSSELQNILKPGLNDLAPSVLLSMEYYSPDLLNLEKNLATLCAATPDCAYGLSGYSIRTYPDEGLSRIVEIKFTYSLSPDEAKRRRTAAANEILRVSNQTQNDTPVTLFRFFHNHIAGTTEWEQTSSSGNTAYDVLIKKRGSAFGIAATFLQLCRAKNLSCYIVNGTYQGNAHTWNMVFLNNAWYHIDLARSCLAPENYDCFMAPSDRMDGYTWTNPPFFD